MTPLPTTCVLDASVGIKLFVPEDYSEDVQGLFMQSLSTGGALYVPDLFFIECLNVLWKKVRCGEYAKDAAIANLADLRLLRFCVTSTADLMERALEIACSYGVTAYDASYAALAEVVEVPLLTADERLRNVLGELIDVRTLSGS